MKIAPPDTLQNIKCQKPKTSERPSENRFEDILHKTLESTSMPKSQPVNIPPVCNLPDIRFDPGFSPERVPIVAKVEGLLDVLEDYQAGLDNPNISLKDLNPLIARIEKETETLLPTLDSLSGDDKVGGILNRALIHSIVEIAKFNRGDYLTP